MSPCDNWLFNRNPVSCASVASRPPSGHVCVNASANHPTGLTRPPPRLTSPYLARTVARYELNQSSVTSRIAQSRAIRYIAPEGC